MLVSTQDAFKHQPQFSPDVFPCRSVHANILARIFRLSISQHREDIECLIGKLDAPARMAFDAAVEDPAAFAMEKRLEGFLVANRSQAELGKDYDIYEEDSKCVG